MSAKKDLVALLASAQRQGAEITPRRSGHWLVKYRGRSVTVSATPRSYGGVLAARADLRRIGLDL